MSGLPRDAGFSLVELLLAMALTGLVMALTAPFVHVQKRLWERSEERRETCRALSGALHWLARDLQQAGYHAACAPLQRIAPDALSYVVSRDEEDPAGFSSANRRLITVWLDGTDVKYRTQAPLDPPASGWDRGSTQVLASGIVAMRFRGLDAEGEETDVASRAHLVECTLSSGGRAEERLLVRLRAGAGGPGS